MKISIKGLSGGHSGMEIDKCKENSIKLLGRILLHLSDKFELNIASINGGLRENAIPSEAEAEIYVDKLYADRFLSEFHRYTEELKKELKVTEPNLSVLLTGCKPRSTMFTRTFTEKFIFHLFKFSSSKNKVTWCNFISKSFTNLTNTKRYFSFLTS